MKSQSVLCAAVLLLTPLASAATVGKSMPPPSLSSARILALPADQQQAWKDYLARSEAMMKADKDALAAERAKLTGPVPPPPAEHAHDDSMPLNKDADWYAGKDARHIADVIVSFQTPAGGWGKNQSREGALRLAGQEYVANNNSTHLSTGDFDTPRNAHWHYVGTIDNDATTTEIRFLARVIAAVPDGDSAAYRASALKGIRYLLNAQYPNGGWPQVWPLEGGYHDAITYNDNAIVEVVETLRTIGDDTGNAYAFVPADLRAAAAQSVKKALDVIVKTQIVADGTPTIWAQQHDCLSLAPAAARNFEPALPSAAESADLALYLMSLPNPSPEVVHAVDAAVVWLKKTAIYGKVWTGKGTPEGNLLKDQSGAGPIWARYYTVDGQPRFADRDKTIHDDVADISKERRNGYSWFNTTPAKVFKHYEKWRKTLTAK